VGPVRNRFRLDRFVLSANVSWLLVRGQAHRTGNGADPGSHLEVLCGIGWGGRWGSSDFQSDAVFCGMPGVSGAFVRMGSGSFVFFGSISAE